MNRNRTIVRTTAALAGIFTFALAALPGAVEAANRTAPEPAAVQCDVDTNEITVTPALAPRFDGQWGAFRVFVTTWTANGWSAWSGTDWKVVQTSADGRNEIFQSITLNKPNGYHYVAVQYMLYSGVAAHEAGWHSLTTHYTGGYTVLDRTVAMGLQTEAYCRL